MDALYEKRGDFREQRPLWARRALVLLGIFCVLFVIYSRRTPTNDGLDAKSQVGVLYPRRERVVNPLSDPLEEDKCMRMCTAVYDPVCASDGQTYSNTCVMGIAACHRNKELTVVHKGECSSDNPGGILLRPSRPGSGGNVVRVDLDNRNPSPPQINVEIDGSAHRSPPEPGVDSFPPTAPPAATHPPVVNNVQPIR